MTTETNAQTPRTDALLGMRNLRWDQLSDHARTLERDLTAARQRIEGLEQRAEEAERKAAFWEKSSDEWHASRGRWIEKCESAESRLAEVEADAALGALVRKKLTSGNCIPMERCTVLASEVTAIRQLKEKS